MCQMSNAALAFTISGCSVEEIGLKLWQKILPVGRQTHKMASYYNLHYIGHIIMIIQKKIFLYNILSCL